MIRDYSSFAGTLRHRITIRREVDIPDGKGGFNRDWSDLATGVPAKIESVNGKEALIGRALQGINTYRITMRFRSDLLPSDQIKTDSGEELNILSVVDPDGRRKKTEVYATSETPQGA